MGWFIQRDGPQHECTSWHCSKGRGLTCTSAWVLQEEKASVALWEISPSDKPALTAFPGSSKKHLLSPELDPSFDSQGGSPTSSPFGNSSGKVQERDVCAITVRIRAQSHSVPAAWVKGECRLCPCGCPKGPKSGKLFYTGWFRHFGVCIFLPLKRGTSCISPRSASFLLKYYSSAISCSQPPLLNLWWHFGKEQWAGHLLSIFQQPVLRQLLLPEQAPSWPDAAGESQGEEKHYSSDKSHLLLQLKGETSGCDPEVTDVAGAVARWWLKDRIFESTFLEEVRRNKSMPTFFTSFPNWQALCRRGEGSDPSAERSEPVCSFQPGFRQRKVRCQCLC